MAKKKTAKKSAKKVTRKKRATSSVTAAASSPEEKKAIQEAFLANLGELYNVYVRGLGSASDEHSELQDRFRRGLQLARTARDDCTRMVNE